MPDLRERFHRLSAELEVADPGPGDDALGRLGTRIAQARRRRRLVAGGAAAVVSLVIAGAGLQILWRRPTAVPATITTAPSEPSGRVTARPAPTPGPTVGAPALPGTATAIQAVGTDTVLVLSGQGPFPDTTVSRIDVLSGRELASRQLPGPPAAMAVIGDDVWVVTRPDTGGSAGPGLAHLRLPDLAPMPVPVLGPEFSAVGADGVVWIGTYGSSGRISSLDPASGTVLRTVPIPDGRAPGQLISDPAGRTLYSVESSDTNQRISARDPRTGLALSTTIPTSSDLGQLIADTTEQTASLFSTSTSALTRLEARTLAPLEIGGSLPPLRKADQVIPVVGQHQILALDVTVHKLTCLDKDLVVRTRVLPVTITGTAVSAVVGRTLVIAHETTLTTSPLPRGCPG